MDAYNTADELEEKKKLNKERKCVEIFPRTERKRRPQRKRVFKKMTSCISCTKVDTDDSTIVRTRP